MMTVTPSLDTHAPHHDTVAALPGRCFGWPSNYGTMQAWPDGDVTLCCGEFDFNYQGPHKHAVTNQKQVNFTVCRRTNGRWSHHHVPHLDSPCSDTPIDTMPEPIAFDHPDLTMTVRYTGNDGGYSALCVSYDRGQTWGQKYRLPLPGQVTAMMGRTAYLIHNRECCTLFLTAPKYEGREGRVFCMNTTDGGRHWQFRSFVGPHFREGFSIMPSVCKSPVNGTWYVALRIQERLNGRDKQARVDIWSSQNAGGTWQYHSTPYHFGPSQIQEAMSSPGALQALDDGRLLCVSTDRPNRRLVARTYCPQVHAWGDAVCLRDGIPNFDFGYCVATLLDQRTAITGYYWNDDTTRERYLATTTFAIPPAPSAPAGSLHQPKY